MEGKTEFIVFCIENIASHLNKNPTDIYKILVEQTNIMKEYIIPNYEVLHTQGREYIVNDIIGVMQKDGAYK